MLSISDHALLRQREVGISAGLVWCPTEILQLAASPARLATGGRARGGRARGGHREAGGLGAVLGASAARGGLGRKVARKLAAGGGRGHATARIGQHLAHLPQHSPAAGAQLELRAQLVSVCPPRLPGLSQARPHRAVGWANSGARARTPA
eukprot:4885077-Lingulodinium_polyedra.AAC.1